MTQSTCQYPSLPPELWLEIFRFATHDAKLYDTKYKPFRVQFSDVHNAPLATNYAIVLVCKLWWILGMELLYEDVRIRHGALALRRALAIGGPGEDYTPKKWVRRAVLPYSQSATPSPKPLLALDILRQLPNLEVLVRPPTMDRYEALALRFEFSADVPSLPLLRRLDWWTHNEASHTGGINALDEVLEHAPNLEYLSLAANISMSLYRPKRIEIPKLRVLHLFHVNALFVRQMCSWDLPSLSHIILAAPPHNAGLEDFWATFGHTIKVAELGDNVRFGMMDHMSDLLDGCPGLEELNYFLFFTLNARPLRTHETLRRVGMHARVNRMMCALDDPETWRHMEQHFDSFRPEAFPALKEFVLYGPEWSHIASLLAFDPIRQKVQASGRRFVLPTL
ncbi:hypothetical protein DENSPDRAFT_793395 [Dentipellis sp. KUC8613]|nr:hypothetical protein DENSPDRAFT_793395 [Dentipellis sp. KUC8613]